MVEEREHAVLSASSAHKWLECTPSARLEELFPSKVSEYMEEGTLAHSIAEFKVRSYFLEPVSKRAYTTRLNKFKKDNHYNEEMLRHTDTYLEYIKGEALQINTKPFISVEQRLDISNYVPEGFGTADCIMISGNTLEIIDFKYGKGVEVSAEDNPQMKLYALGALNQFGFLYLIENIKMVIVQPRLDNISEAFISKEDLLKWAEIDVKPKAQQAFMGLGNFVTGSHCRFCKARGGCEFRAKENIKIVEEVQNSQILSNIELSEVLTKTDGLEQWLKDIREYALDTLLKGEEIPGWKAVEGKSNRRLADVEKAFEILKANGFNEALLYERKPLTLTALEKTVGKKELTAAIGDYIEKSKGAPTLVKESDKREKYNNKMSAKEEFSIKNESEE